MLFNKTVLPKDEIRSTFVKLTRNSNLNSMFVAMIDANDMKGINDSHGHVAGDNVIARLSHILSYNATVKDMVFHFGGDEFCIFFTNQDEKTVRRTVEKIKLEILNDSYLKKEVGGISASIGVAEYNPRVHKTVESIVEEADTCLYAAKTSRHLVVFKSDPIDISKEANQRRDDLIHRQLREYFRSMVKMIKIEYPEIHDQLLRESARNVWRINGKKIIKLGTPSEVMQKVLGEYKRLQNQLKKKRA